MFQTTIHSVVSHIWLLENNAVSGTTRRFRGQWVKHFSESVSMDITDSLLGLAVRMQLPVVANPRRVYRSIFKNIEQYFAISEDHASQLECLNC